MKTLISTLFLGAGLVLGGCGDKNKEDKNNQRIEYTIRDTIANETLTYLAIKDKDFYLLKVKGNLDNKYSMIIFADMDNNNSINMEDYVTFYKNDSIDTHLGYNGVVKGLWKMKEPSEFYNASDSSKLSQAIVKEARNQMENYFNPLYKKLRARAEDKYKKGIGIIPNSLPITKVFNQDSIINKKIKEFF